MKTIVIATMKPWNIQNAKEFNEKLKNRFHTHLITRREDLTEDSLGGIHPEYVFFPHWSWKIPPEIYERFRCVVFHMTDLPYGRGGTPLQNLIMNKITTTKISAIKVDKDLDSGDVYLKEDMHIGSGSAEEIYKKASDLVFFKMIPFILETEPDPVKQAGDVVTFRRRTPEESDLAAAPLETMQDYYDFIRMLDAEGYPKARIRLGTYKVLFSEVHRKHDRLVGRFEIVKNETE